MARTTMGFVLVLTASCLIACSPLPNIEALVPSVGREGDVIDIRDSTGASLSQAGTVMFGTVTVPQTVVWTPEDVYVQVPSGITATVPVAVSVDGLLSNIRHFSFVEHVDPHRIMCFGDSIFKWGVPPVLQNLIYQDPDLNALELIVLDHSKAGEALTGSETWLRWQNAVQHSDSDLVFLLEGTNDVTDSSNILMETLQQRVINMMDEALLAGLDPALCTLLPRVGSCGDSETPTTEEFNDWLKSYADGVGIPVVDVYEDFSSTPDWQNVYFKTDCVHPTAHGRQRIAELLRDKMREVYVSSCSDLDEDGYGDPASSGCPHPEWDCDDSDPDVHPDAAEDCYNGIDDDCDADVDFDDSDCPCWDVDEDLFDDQACGGTDCDDSDPAVKPGMNEGPFGDPVCSDEIDNDCDGDIDTLDPGCTEQG